MRRRALWLIAIWWVSSLELAAMQERLPRTREFTSPAARFWVEQAVAGAVHRLSTDGCARILNDFTDDRNRTLRERLDALRVTIADYLTSWLWFVDGSNQRQCDSRFNRTAFTTPGSRVIYICGKRIVKAALSATSPQAQFVVIHEVLHSLGLGENPPSSEEITRQVVRRCA